MHDKIDGMECAACGIASALEALFALAFQLIVLFITFILSLVQFAFLYAEKKLAKK